MGKIKIIVNVLRLTLVFAIIASIFYGSWYNLFVSLFTIVLTFLPTWVEKKYKIDIPLDFELATILFIYASLFLGVIGKFYELFWWWDILLHAASAVAFACIGFVVLFILFITKKLTNHPVWVAIFSFCFSLSIGALWEIFEFTADQLVGTNMQKSGLVDTMGDLISDAAGAAIASLAGYFYIKGGQKSYLGRLIDLTIKSNTDLKSVPRE